MTRIIIAFTTVALLIAFEVMADTPYRRPTLVNEVLKELPNSVVSFTCNVHRGDLDPIKANTALGLHEGYEMTEDARAVLARNLENYPILIEKPSSNEDQASTEAQFCDYFGAISIAPKNGQIEFVIELHVGDAIVVKKVNKETEEIESIIFGGWLDCERTVFVICLLMRQEIWPDRSSPLKQGSPLRLH
ncbi:MAG: hypothetical protein KDN20_05740 [Verrucomicrobiae bacterium]|nr:hypothetical protein [Verrucomicrobiae bacterium]